MHKYRSKLPNIRKYLKKLKNNIYKYLFFGELFYRNQYNFDIDQPGDYLEKMSFFAEENKSFELLESA